MLLAFVLAHLQTASPLADPRLDRPLAIEARIEPLPDMLARMGREAGIPLTVERRARGWKATVFTPARPLRLTLAGLASVFDAEWTPTKDGGYQLGETVPARGRRGLYLEREEEIRRLGAESRLIRVAPVPEFVPTGDEAKDGPLRRMSETTARRQPIERQIVAAFAGLSPADRERFWRGELLHVVGTTEGQPEERKPQGNGTLITPHPAGPNLTLMSYRSGNVGLRVAAFAPNMRSQTLWGTSIPADEPSLADHPFRRAQREWATDPASSAPEWTLPLKTMPVEPDRWAKGRRTSDDVLGEIARRSGVPVVAEANRRLLDTRLPLRGATLGEAVRSGSLGEGAVRLESGTLLYRPAGFWQARLVEPPETSFRAIERETNPSLDSLAAFYADLLPPTLTETRGIVSVRDLSGDEDAKAALRLWGRLSTPLRTRLEGGEAIPLASLPGEARGAVEEAVVEAIFAGAGVDVAGDHSASMEARATREMTTLLGLLGLGPGGSYTLSARVSRDGGSPERRSLSIRIADDGGNVFRFPKAGPH